MKKFFKVYLPFTANELKRNLTYKGAFYLFIFCSLFGTFINYFLWMAIYGSSSSATLGGLTRQEMVVYVFMSYVTAALSMIGISDIDHLFTDNIWLVAWRYVINGSFDRYMLRPMNVFFQVISEKLQPDALGELLIGFTLVGISLGKGIVIVDFAHVVLFIVSVKSVGYPFFISSLRDLSMFIIIEEILMKISFAVRDFCGWKVLQVLIGITLLRLLLIFGLDNILA